MKLGSILALLAAAAFGAAAAQAQDSDAIFMIKSTTKEPDAVVAAIKAHAEQNKWQYLGESKVKQGEIRLVKLCMPEVGQLLWPVGPQLSAMLPCGNVGVYRKGTVTEISVLHPRYMPLLYPHAATERAAAVAQPLLAGMLEAIAAPPPLVVKPIVEKKLAQLPAGPLFWRIETLPTLAAAQTAAGPTALAAEISGKAWLFTLGPKDGTTPGAEKVAEVGPVPTVNAAEYLLRINHASGPPTAETPVHSHPGSEAFYVLKGRLGQKTPHGTVYAEAGSAMNGHGADMPMVVFSAGTADLDQLVMFVVDASKPFSSPARFQ